WRPSSQPKYSGSRKERSQPRSGMSRRDQTRLSVEKKWFEKESSQQRSRPRTVKPRHRRALSLIKQSPTCDRNAKRSPRKNRARKEVATGKRRPSRRHYLVGGLDRIAS